MTRERVTNDAVTREHLRVVRGEPTEEELAALVVALATRASTTTPPAPPRNRWADPASRMRQPLHPGPGAWRWS